MAQNVDDEFKNPVLSQNLETMLSNKKYCDTVFLVNKSRFNASSHLVSVSSPELEAMIDEHYEHTGDREIRLGSIKNEDSFVVILRYIYGMTLKFSCMKIEVLCEVIRLSERFKLPALSLKLKSYLAAFEEITLDSLVVLLNTAKEYHLEELSGRLTLFAYKNVQQLVQHVSFRDLRYDILSKFVKSNNFYVKEIELMKGVLMWHANNITNPMDDNHDTTFESMAQDIDCENDQLVETFSRNILKSLISHIRIKTMPYNELLVLSSSEIYLKNKDILDDFENYSPIKDNRVSIFAPIQPVPMNDIISSTKLLDIYRKFTYLIIQPHEELKSKEIHSIDGLKWQMRVKITEMSHDMGKIYISLTCQSNVTCNWECVAECRIKIISMFPKLFLPGESTFSSLSFNSTNTLIEVGNLYYPFYLRDAYKSRTKSSEFSFQVYFKSIHKIIKH